ncbi:MAG TPA: ABC transporter ATP-binding protein, partial [Acholeplasmataceae bacterium]|nr:ABC transporter ATP-binding protein [Acholeplasmataceae bacterium]
MLYNNDGKFKEVNMAKLEIKNLHVGIEGKEIL